MKSMSKFRMIHTDFWDDPIIVEEFTPEDKLFFLYLLTNPSTTQIGIYTITRKKMAYELGYSIETINSLMRRFIDQHKMIEYNEETREMFIKKWGKWNYRSGGRPVEDLVRKELRIVKHTPFIESAAAYIENERIRAVFSEFYETDKSEDWTGDTSHDWYNDTSNDSLNDSSDDSSHDTSHDRGYKKEEVRKKKEERRTIKENKASTDVDLSLFEQLWKSYPKKVEKKKAVAAYQKAIKKGVTHETIAAGLDNYLQHLKHESWRKPADGGRWFQNERWTDEYDNTPRQAPGRPPQNWEEFKPFNG